MRKIRLLVTLLCLFLGIIPALAQSVQIVEEMKQVPYASVMAMYKNEFGSFEKPVMRPSFPYAVIRMHLEGNAPSVRAAKERITLYMGQQTGVESRVTTYSNQILFLVRAPRHPMIYIDCGDGCERVLLSNMQQLEPNCLYDCKVRFIMEGESPTNDTVFVERGPRLYPLNLHVEPKTAQVEVVAHGERRDWILDNGHVSLQLLEGDYSYTISANGYYTEKGTIRVPTNQSDTTIRLRCTRGWLSIVSDSTDLAGLFAKISHPTGDLEVSLPCDSLPCVPGNYTVTIRKPNSYPYGRVVSITENTNTRLAPRLVSRTKSKSPKISNIEPPRVVFVSNDNAVVRGELSGHNAIEKGLIINDTQNISHGVKVVLGEKGAFEQELLNLIPGTQYFICTYECNEMDTIYSELVSFLTLQNAPVENGHRYADLGLSVKWAVCNVGAEQSEQYGDYFAWGETEPKKIYNWETYTWCDGVSNALNKYNVHGYNGKVDNKTSLTIVDDAARVNWGGNWRMPTDDEWKELLDNCKWIWTTLNGVKGYRVISKKNGNSIFFPAAGYKEEYSLFNAGSHGYYWSTWLDLDNTDSAWYLYVYSKGVLRYNHLRSVGRSVRPVCP